MHISRDIYPAFIPAQGQAFPPVTDHQIYSGKISQWIYALSDTLKIFFQCILTLPNGFRTHRVPKEFNSLMEVFHIYLTFPIFFHILLTLHSSSIYPRIVSYTILQCYLTPQSSQGFQNISPSTPVTCHPSWDHPAFPLFLNWYFVPFSN